MSLFDLPRDLIEIEFIKYLPILTFLNYSSTCRSLARLSTRLNVWKFYLRRDYSTYLAEGEYPEPEIIYFLIWSYLRLHPESSGINISHFRYINPKTLRLLKILPRIQLRDIETTYNGLKFHYRLRFYTRLDITDTWFPTNRVGLDLKITETYPVPKPIDQCYVYDTTPIWIQIRLDEQGLRSFIDRYLAIASIGPIRNPNLLIDLTQPYRQELESRPTDNRLYSHWTDISGSRYITIYNRDEERQVVLRFYS